MLAHAHLAVAHAQAHVRVEAVVVPHVQATTRSQTSRACAAKAAAAADNVRVLQVRAAHVQARHAHHAVRPRVQAVHALTRT